MREETSGKNRTKATFVVKIDYCRNATWQGRLLWAEENREMPFRSAMELISLMDSALGTSSTEEENALTAE